MARRSRWTLTLEPEAPDIAIGDHVAVAVAGCYLGAGVVEERDIDRVTIQIVEVPPRDGQLELPGEGPWAQLAVERPSELVDWLDETGEAPREAPRRGSAVWHPQSIPAAVSSEAMRQYSYVTVDEFVDTRVGLHCAPWPALDRHGRLRFDLEGASLLGLNRQELTRFLRDHRVLLLLRPDGDTAEAVGADSLSVGETEAEGTRTRALAIGDVFAIPHWVVEEARGGDLKSIKRGAVVFDLTLEARERAKLAAAGARSPTTIVVDASSGPKPAREARLEEELSVKPWGARGALAFGPGGEEFSDEQLLERIEDHEH